jgi:hypothetical protein
MHRLLVLGMLLVGCSGSTGKTCSSASDCPGDPTCTQITCSSHTCQYLNYTNQSASPKNVAGDCQQIICDGNGGYLVAVDMTDRPPQTSPCQIAQCGRDGTVITGQAAAGTSCGPSVYCDAAGACVGCTTPTQCPGTDTECHMRTCDNEKCGMNNVAANTKVVLGQVKGDCHSIVCDGNGGTMNIEDDTDAPATPSVCVTKTCMNGTVNTANAGSGTSCGTGIVCNGNGICGECDMGSDCPGAGSDDLCRTHSCTNHACGTTNAMDGTTCADSTAQTRCRAGNCVAAFAVVRAGDGSNVLSTAAAALQVEERYASDGAMVGSAAIALPTATAGTNAACTGAGLGSASTTDPSGENFLARSADEHYLTLACYDAGPLTATIASSTVSRVIARIDMARAVDTTTQLAAFSGQSVHSAASSDGMSLWIAGNVGSVQYTTLAATTATQIVTTPASVKVIETIGSQLYGTSDATNGFANVFAIGAGEPTTAGQTCTPLPGLPTGTTALNQPLGFALVTVGATPTLYLADSRASASGGGIEKWTFNGTTWTLVTTFDGLASGTGIYSLTAYVTGTTVTVLAVSNAATGNLVVSYTDDGTTAPAPTTIATAPANTGYRGIALAPH